MLGLSPLPVPIVTWVIQISMGCLIIALVVRAFASWFQLDERIAFIRFLARLTDPFIMPIRRLIGRVWILDISFLVALFMLLTLRVLLLQALPAGW
jgi:YggT family protein